MGPLLLAAVLAFAQDPRADFLQGKPLQGDSPAAQVQKGRYDLLEQVAKQWSFTPQERQAAEELYRPKYQLQGQNQGRPVPAQIDHERSNAQAMGRAKDIASRLKWDRSAGDMPAGVAAAPAPAAARQPVDYKTLNAQTRGGPRTVRVNDVPSGVSDVDRFQAVFRDSVARMDREGLRDPGHGALNGVWNNVQASLLPDSKKLRCFDQAEQLVGDLEKGGFDRRQWTFRIRSYTGDGHEANGHYWVEAVSKDPKQPTVVMDPWKNTIKTIDVKEETVIKPYGAFWMGWAMDKLGL